MITLVSTACLSGEQPAAGVEEADAARRAVFATGGRAVDYSSLPAHEENRPQSPPEERPAAERAHGVDEPLRVVFLGNTLIQRAAQFGYVEAELTRRLPSRALSFRNLGWPGDTVDGAARVEFGPGEENSRAWQRPDEAPGDYGFRKMLGQLKRERPHVLFIAYGSNVAFDGERALDRFRAGLTRLLDTLAPTGVRIVLVSPPPRELGGGFPGHLGAQNRWLKEVSAHLMSAARHRGLALVDLFGAWEATRSPASAGWTDNGIHLNDRGYQRMAKLVADALLPESGAWAIRMKADGSVLETNSTDVPSVHPTEYGLRWRVADRALPAATPGARRAGASAARRLSIEGLEGGTYTLDIDGRRVARASAGEWARGVTLEGGPDDARVDELRQAIRRKNGLYFHGFRPQNKAYTHLFRRHERGHHAAEIERFALLVSEAEEEISRLRRPRPRIYELVREQNYPDHEVPGEAAQPDVVRERESFRIPEGFEINLFAADPMVAKPININWDARGRVWVATSRIYPHLQPGQSPDDRILILEDIDRDGRADKSTVFASGLLVPQSVLPGDGGAYVTQSTDLLFLRDVDGDDRADERRVLFTGFGNADVHHMIHGLRWGPGGDVYFTQSIYINSIVETPWGLRTSNGSCVWRLRPETLRLEKYAQGLVNPWGFAFDDRGQAFATDGAGGSGISYMFPDSAYITHGYAGRELEALNPGRPKECGLDVLSGRHLPPDWRGTLITNDFRANRVTRYRLTASDSGYASEFLGDMVTSRHRGFRPVDVKMGPDGAIYIVDWYNLIIDHGEVDFHHPLRDKQHGRIWRLSVAGSPPVDPPRLIEASAPELLGALEVPEQWTREQARRRLRELGAAKVLPEVGKWLADPARTDHDRLEALWLLQGLRVSRSQALDACLRSEDHRVRAAAVRVLADWQDRIDGAMNRLERAVADSHPQVRLEAVNALRQIGSRTAVEVALRAVDEPLDPWIEFALFRTAHELRDVWLPAFEAGQGLFDGDPRRVAFALSAVGSEASLAPLGKLVSERRVEGRFLLETLSVLAAFGSAEQRALVVDRLEGLPVDAVRRVLTALVQAGRGDAPANRSSIVSLFDAADADVRTLAMTLAGRWAIETAFAPLNDVARREEVADEERLVAGRALIAIDSRRAAGELRAIHDAAASDRVRATAVAAWAQGAGADAAPRAVKLLASDLEETSIHRLADAFLTRKDGERHLAEALEGARLPEEAARAIIERARLAGKEVRQLLSAVRRAGRLQPLANLSPDEIVGILRDVPDAGSVDRGAAVFRRDGLQCATCHVVNGKGGRVGPDLSSLGGSARMGDILRSLIEPSASIKEGYQTAHVIQTDGTIVSGILQQRTASHVTVRDAKDQLRTIPVSDVVAVETSQVSVMPTGLTEALERSELVDLVRYLSSLGQEGAGSTPR